MRHSKQTNPEKLRAELTVLLENFERKLKSEDLRDKVKALVPAYHLLRDLGSSLILKTDASSARDRILLYFRKYPRKVIAGDELMVVSGIGEWARRVRELRVEFGWDIISGVTAKEMAESEGDAEIDGRKFSEIKTDEYVLMQEEQERDAAFRWNLANDIRKKKLAVKDKILEYLQKNVGKPVTGEELKYLAKDRSEWARRVRELRTEEGWPVSTKTSGRPDLSVGVYVLEEIRQAPVHDRQIPDPVRCEVLERDEFKCRGCGWSHDMHRPEDPRGLLELHHILPHAKKGENTKGNLVTLCNVCHDEVHRRKDESVEAFMKEKGIALEEILRGK